ncbi:MULTISPECIES: guanylate kinase [unclassified Micromonospora]|uniref:guanylate kinase n=1 Tax=unclassified Micromonospora TaxID=2617518 RepID=UPI0022B69AA4|nr:MULTISPECIES: guanylate kinase [unclassified Micromonospora]MCZ7419678.1 guanylate kinase [Verrucosispora sp. WMMA2121]WBB89751.1 guanylate kinase [Verrucosispora sp. WMMC514]
MSLDDEARPAARLTVLAGPSGAGRESVVELVRARSPSVWTPIAVTTRPRRDSELDGVHRHFVTSEEFDRRLAEGELLEWSRLGGYRRGTEITPLRRRLAAGQPVLLALDLAGALLVRAGWPEARIVLLHPPGRLPGLPVVAAVDLSVSHDRVERVVDELVGFIGSSFLAPARPRPRG